MLKTSLDAGSAVCLRGVLRLWHRRPVDVKAQLLNLALKLGLGVQSESFRNKAIEYKITSVHSSFLSYHVVNLACLGKLLSAGLRMGWQLSVGFFPFFFLYIYILVVRGPCTGTGSCFSTPNAFAQCIPAFVLTALQQVCQPVPPAPGELQKATGWSF